MSEPHSNNALSACDLLLFRGERCLLDGVSLSVAPGEGIALRGPNGTGKTTLLRVLCGLSDAEEGDVFWQGKSIRSQRIEWQQVLGWSGHLSGFKADLTVRENLNFHAALYGYSPQKLPAELELSACEDLPVRALSAGQKRRTALASVILGNAGVWMLDEPYTNLDIQGVDYLNNVFRKHLENNGILIIASHGEAHAGVGLRELTLSKGQLS